MKRKGIGFFLVFSFIFYVLFATYFIFTFNSLKTTKEKNISKISQYINTQINSAYSIEQNFSSDYFKKCVKDVFLNHKNLEGIIIDAGKDNLYFIHLRNNKLLNESSSLRISQGKVPNFSFFGPLKKIVNFTISGKDDTLFNITFIFSLFDRVSIFPILKKALVIILCYFALSLLFFLALPDSLPQNDKNSDKEKKDEIINKKNVQKEIKTQNPTYEVKISSNNHQSDEDIEKIIETVQRVKGKNSIKDDQIFAENNPTKKVQPNGMYSDKSGLVWENFLPEKLDAELKRATSFDQDSCLIYLKIKSSSGFIPYKNISELIIEVFQYRDLAFESGDDSFCIILPDQDLNEGQNTIDNFLKVFLKQFPEPNFKLYAGITSRSSRMLNSDRMMQEAESALRKAEQEEKSTSIAFRADLTKYRQWISQNKSE